MIIDLDDVEVCFLCEVQQECSEGHTEPKLSGEWVCTDCRDAGKVQEFLDNED